MRARLARNGIAGHGAAVAFAAAALFAFGAPAHAQRLSLAERVTRLEQQAQQQNGEQGGVGLVNQVQALQSQIQQMQGRIEELEHKVQQLQQSSKDQYVDLDSRLQRLEGGKPAAAASAPSTGVVPASAATAAASPAKPATTAQAQQAQGPDKAGTKPADPAAAADAYNTAFTALRNGNFVQASRGFRDFLQDYPDSDLAPNARYWLGESYYATQNYQVALDTFQSLVQQYPSSEKTPGAWLKIGYCQNALKQDDAASVTLKAVIAKYPDSDVAKLAEQRLRDIQLQAAH